MSYSLGAEFCALQFLFKAYLSKINETLLNKKKLIIHGQANLGNIVYYSTL